MGVSAFWIIVALLIGGEMFGIVGMFFAVPVMAFVLEVLKDVSNARLKEKGIDGSGNPVAAETVEEAVDAAKAAETAEDAGAEENKAEETEK